VVEPFSSGLGGGGLYLIHRASDGMQTLVDARERAPENATADMFLDAKGEVDENQTFHQEHLDSGTHGTQATSMAVRTDK